VASAERSTDLLAALRPPTPPRLCPASDAGRHGERCASVEVAIRVVFVSAYGDGARPSAITASTAFAPKFEFKIWSGARDLNPGPHGPEPCELSSRKIGNDRSMLSRLGSFSGRITTRSTTGRCGESRAIQGMASIADQPIGQDIDLEGARESSQLPTVLKTARLASSTAPPTSMRFDSRLRVP
jgi:hypothetical protein